MIKNLMRKIQLLALTISSFLGSLLPQTVLGQVLNIQPGRCEALGLASCPQDRSSILLIIWNIVNAFLVFVAVLAVIFLIWAGVRYIMSRGDEQEAEKAKYMILYAVLGLIVIGLSGVIVNFVIAGFQGN